MQDMGVPDPRIQVKWLDFDKLGFAVGHGFDSLPCVVRESLHLRFTCSVEIEGTNDGESRKDDNLKIWGIRIRG